MAGLDPATQRPRVRAARKALASDEHEGEEESLSRTDERALGGRVTPGHDELVGLARGVLCFLAFTLSLFVAHAVEPDEMLPDPALEARARVITQELRCVVCQNQSVDDSDAPLAHDIRVLVRERIAKGDTDAQARDYIVSRYGNFVLLRPPLQADTLLLWFGPALLLAGGLALAWAYVARLGRVAPAPTPLSAAEEDAVKRRLDDGAA